MTPLRVGIDTSPLVLTRAGTARYLRNLLAALDEEESLEIRRYRFGGNGRLAKVARDTGWYLAGLPLLARRDRIDVLHCPTIRAPIRSSMPIILSIHDLAVVRHPELFNRWTAMYSGHLLPPVARAAAAVLTGSEFARREILHLLDVPEAKVRVTPYGVGPPFTQEGPAVAGDYVLTVATLEPRKNLPRLVEAFQLARLEGIELRVVGARGWGDVEVNGTGVKLLGEVADEELARLYRGARCVAYVSLYEGFGFPVLEAMACGAAVVTSRGGACEEVGGSAVVLVDPFDVQSIADGLREAVDRRAELSELGRARASAFDWKETARAAAAVYHEVAS
jgi:glycosyltransferase involved in cell wall biosynthesis